MELQGPAEVTIGRCQTLLGGMKVIKVDERGVTLDVAEPGLIRGSSWLRRQLMTVSVKDEG
jgi:hypothetical protein